MVYNQIQILRHYNINVVYMNEYPYKLNLFDEIMMYIVHSLSSGKVKMFLCAACHAFTPHVNAWKH